MIWDSLLAKDTIFIIPKEMLVIGLQKSIPPKGIKCFLHILEFIRYFNPIKYINCGSINSISPCNWTYEYASNETCRT